MKLTALTQRFTFLFFLCFLIGFPSVGLSDACMDNIASVASTFGSSCTGQAQCYVTHPEGYGVPTNNFVPLTIVTKILNGNIEFSCKAGTCPKYTWPYYNSSTASAALCAGQPFVNTAIRIAKALHNKNFLICGSIVGVDDQTLGETIPLHGAKFSLNYFTHFTSGRGNYFISLPLTDTAPAPDTSSFSIKVLSSDGQYANVTLQNQSHLSYTFSWNGKDLNGQPVVGTKDFTIEWTQNFSNGSPTITMRDTTTLGGFNAKFLGLGGWLPSIYMFYNPTTDQLFSGDGSVTNVRATEVNSIPGVEYMIAKSDRSKIYYFDATGKLKFIATGTTGTTIFTFMYDSQSRLISINEPFNLKTEFTRSQNGQTNNIIAPRGSYTPANPGNMTAESGLLVTRWVLDSNGNLESVRPVDGWEGGIWNPSYYMTYDSSGLLKTFQTPIGLTSTFTYDNIGNLIRDENSNGYFFDLIRNEILQNQYSINKSEVGGLSTNYEITENGSGFVNRTVTSPGGFQESASMSEHWDGFSSADISHSNYYITDINVAGARYPTQENVTFGNISVTKYSSASTSYSLSAPLTVGTSTITRDLASRRDITTYNSAIKTYRSYRQSPGSTTGPYTDVIVDSYERPTSIKVGSLNPTIISYNQDLLTSILKGGNSTYFKYNSIGQLTGIGDSPTTNKVTYTYDDLGNIYSMSTAGGRTIYYVFDGNGNLNYLTATTNRLNVFVLNPDNSTAMWSSPLGNTTFYDYNLNKTLSKITKPSGNEVNFSYSPTSGKLIKITTAEGDTNYYYNSSTGKLDSILNPAGFIINLSSVGPFISSTEIRDPLNTEIGTYSATRNTTTGLIASETVSVGTSLSTINHSYNLDLMKIQVGDMTIQYDENDLVSGTTIGNITENYTRDTDGYITSRSVKFNGVEKFNETLTFNSKKKATYIVQVNLSGNLNSFTESITYDPDDRVSTYLKQYSPPPGCEGKDCGVPFPNQLTYNYPLFTNPDAGNNAPISVNDQGITSYKYVYDLDDHLTSVQRLHAGSLVSSTDFTYTQDGILSTKYSSNSSTGGYTLTYDDFGNLRTVLLQNGNVISYEIDGLNRRIGKKINGVLQRRWIYQDQYRIAAELDTNGNISKRFVYASGKHIPDYMVVGTEKFKLIADRLGSIKAVMRVSDGAIVFNRSFSMRGSSSTPDDPNLIPFGFAGGLNDPDTGLVRFGARDYEPSIGRWTAKDPIGFDGGDTNLYGYVGNDPINFIDTEGLRKKFVYSNGMLSFYDDNGGLLYEGPAKSGPWGNGSLPKGSYAVGAMRDNRTGSYACPGSSGYSLNLHNRFPTNRTDLRIHPDGGTPGTLGCIGISCSDGSADALGEMLRGIYAQPMTPWIDLEVK